VRFAFPRLFSAPTPWALRSTPPIGSRALSPRTVNTPNGSAPNGGSSNGGASRGNGRTPVVVISVAHLDDEERMLVLGVIFEEILSYTRSLSAAQFQRSNKG
jgi:hypothetical protein